eukprot:CAMPEP_0119041300 /NCGR_PEP_ID=MMETSP1177-20130426/11515_1 /TAXON_ID=2985 /ORGANISM="Ochromonas sp, Strain CCMP1899" /LENGTH=479 /DNA_ID=CAMNT_0007007231 /DNA_START=91 /DNA_END=1527 /DNA_ORIENTATION=-
MMRWSQEETSKLIEMKKLLHNELQKRRQLPDVVGDRRLLRFLRGHGHNVEKACKMFAKFLLWRDENNVDAIRDDILYGNIRNPRQFPCGEKILRLVPQMMLSADALDNEGNPLSLEFFNFVPEIVLRDITKKEYVIFMIYMLEYKILLLEQLASERELVNINTGIENEPYGVIVGSRVIRDLNGFGLGHVGTDGQTVIKWILEIAVDNYPELLHKCHMINVPWIFNSIWFFVKGLMDSNTLKKVSLEGKDFSKGLLKEVPIASVPIAIGGTFIASDILLEFNTTRNGPFYIESEHEKLKTSRKSQKINDENSVTGKERTRKSNKSLKKLLVHVNDDIDIKGDVITSPLMNNEGMKRDNLKHTNSDNTRPNDDDTYHEPKSTNRSRREKKCSKAKVSSDVSSKGIAKIDTPQNLETVPPQRRDLDTGKTLNKTKESRILKIDDHSGIEEKFLEGRLRRVQEGKIEKVTKNRKKKKRKESW